MAGKRSKARRGKNRNGKRRYHQPKYVPSWPPDFGGPSIGDLLPLATGLMMGAKHRKRQQAREAEPNGTDTES